MTLLPHPLGGGLLICSVYEAFNLIYFRIRMYDPEKEAYKRLDQEVSMVRNNGVAFVVKKDLLL